MNIKFSDRALIGETKKTVEGYLIATSRIARTGVQEYLASELGDAADGFKSSDVVRVYRHADQVFSADSLQSLTRIPITIDHPKVMVDSDNWKDLAVGDLGDRFTQDGEWLVANPMLKDAAALAAATSTHKELSAGYTAEIVAARDGIDADFEMVNIRFNHLALVSKGRAGSQARLADSWGAMPLDVKDKDKTMTVELKTVILGDKSVQVEAKDADTVAAILKDHKTALDAKDAEIGRLTIEAAKVLTDSQIADLVKAKVKADTQRAAVKALIGDAADKLSDAQIDGAFAVIGDSGGDETMRKAITDKKSIDDADARVAAAQKKFLNLEVK